MFVHLINFLAKKKKIYFFWSPSDYQQNEFRLQNPCCDENKPLALTKPRKRESQKLKVVAI